MGALPRPIVETPSLPGPGRPMQGPRAGMSTRYFFRAPTLELSGGEAVRLGDGLGRCAAGRSQRTVAGNGAMNAIETASAKSEENQASDGKRLHKQSGVTERG